MRVLLFLAVVLLFSSRSFGQSPEEVSQSAREARAKVLGIKLSGLVRECSPDALKARRDLRDVLRQGAKSGSDLYEFINADSRLEEQACYSTLKRMEEAQQALAVSAVAIVDVARIAQDFGVTSAQVEAKRVELGDYNAKIGEARRQGEELTRRNLDATLSVLRSTRFFDTTAPDKIIKDYLSRKENKLTISNGTVLVTPFGFFAYEPTVRLDGSAGRETLVFQPLDLYRGDPILAAYREMQIQYLTRFKIGAQLSSSKFTIDPAGETAKDITFLSPERWQWSIQRSWFRPRQEKENGLISVRGGATAASENLTSTPFRVEIQSDGWFTTPATFIEGILTLKGLVEVIVWIWPYILLLLIGMFFSPRRRARKLPLTPPAGRP